MAAVRAAVVAAALGAPAAVAQEVLSPDARYPEGPLVADGGLYVAEMGRDRVVFIGSGGQRIVWEAPGCLPTSVESYRDALLVLCHRPGALGIVSRDGELVDLISTDSDGQRFTTPNASAPDGRGGVYFSSSGHFAPTAPAAGAVLHLTAAGRLIRVAEDIHYANGVALSADGATLFVSEHLGRNVLAFDVGPDGTLTGRRIAVRLDALVGDDPERNWDVGPDGLAVDGDGNLYVAEYGAGRMLIVSPDGDLLEEIGVEETYVTAPALSADERTIFLTAPAARDPNIPGKVYALPNPLAR